MAQLEMFNEAPAVSAAPSAEQVRARLEAIFATLRCGDKVAWNELRRLKLVVPQMAQWLPEAERAEISAEFERLTATDQATAA
jgi:hypothetical protein